MFLQSCIVVQKTKNTSKSLTAAMLLHYHEHTHFSLFIYLTNTVQLLETLSKAANVEKSNAKNFNTIQLAVI